MRKIPLYSTWHQRPQVPLHARPCEAYSAFVRERESEGDSEKDIDFERQSQ